jgi:hypothetical protein
VSWTGAAALAQYVTLELGEQREESGYVVPPERCQIECFGQRYHQLRGCAAERP